MKRKISLILLITMIFSLLYGCGDKKSGDKNTDTVKAMVSFNVLKDITNEIGKDKVEVSVMVPNGVEAHDFEPKPKDMATLNDADIFIYNGLDMEPWAKATLKTLDSHIITVEAAKNAGILELKNHKDEKEHGKYDPHIWLSLKETKIMAQNIMEGLIKVDAKNKEFYLKNFKEFTGKLDALIREYDEKFTTVNNKNFVTGHEAFAYLCRDFKLNEKTVAGVFNEGEATSTKIKEVIDFCKSNSVKTIFMEEGTSPKVAETISKEIGAEVETLNTLENEGNYVDTMKDNLEKIYTSLKK